MRTGGLVCFNLRTDQIEEWEPTLSALSGWVLVERTEPVSYLPADPRYAATVLSVAFAYRVP